MKRFFICCASVIATLIAAPAFAHPLDVAYMDVGAPADNGGPSADHLTMTVAIHPYQAFELVRAGSTARFDLKQLQARGDLISAYVQDHVQVTRAGNDCVWHAGDAHTPHSELDAVADGVTVTGVLDCPGTGNALEMSSTLFLEGFPQQANIVRLETPNGYAERLTLNRQQRSASLDLSPILPGGAWAFTSTSTVGAQTSSRRPDAAIIDIANRLLDPGLGWLEFAGLLLAAAAVGMLHALGPGHGKSLLAATLVGQKATVGRAVVLASVMAGTHVADVFLMAILASVIAAVLPPTTLLQWLTMASAAGLAALGLFSLVRAIRRYREVQKHPSLARQDDDAHARAHALGIAHQHEDIKGTRVSGLAGYQERAPMMMDASGISSDPLKLVHATGLERPQISDVHHHETFRQSLWMGFVGSLAPCPTAWAMFMATLSIGRLGAGIALLVAFSIGLYATVVLIGILLVLSKRFALTRTSPRITYLLPILSAIIITALGVSLLIPSVLYTVAS